MPNELEPLRPSSAETVYSSIDRYDDKLPDIVLQSVSVEDHQVPILTFRYFVLTFLLVVPGAFISTMNSYRTTSAPYSIFFVQIASHYLGQFMANHVPSYKLKIGRFVVDTNPGPWSIKETVMVTLSCASGATGNLGTMPISLGELYYQFPKTSTWNALFFMWSIVWTGYALAALCKSWLLYDPQYIWPKSLMQATLFNTQAKSHSHSMTLFMVIVVGITCWEFLPEYVFPMTSSVALLCYVSSSPTVNFIGSGLGGMGFLNFSFDWSNITSSVMITPYWTQVIQFVGFGFACWVLIPLAKWTNVLGTYKHGLMSNALFTHQGKPYPFKELVKNNVFNQDAFEKYGPPLMGTQKVWNMFFSYAAYTSSMVWLLLFGYNQYKHYFGKYNKKEFNDPLNRIRRSYKDVPTSWFALLFIMAFSTLYYITQYSKDEVFHIPLLPYFMSLATGAIIVIPLSWLYAISNFQLAIGTFNELMYGYMIHSEWFNPLAQFNPAGAAIYGSIAGDAWYRAQFMLQDQKVGHYMHIPPRCVFFSQIFGEIIGIPMNYIALRWVLKSKSNYLTGREKDPLNQWSGQVLSNYNTNSIQYVFLGPSRLFESYPWLPYGFLFGILSPAVMFLLHKKWHALKYFNTTIFFATLSDFYGNVSTGYLSKFVGGSAIVALVKNSEKWRNRHAKYNYVIAAALDTGYNLAVVLIFILFGSANKKMVHWWGNDAQNIEHCSY